MPKVTCRCGTTTTTTHPLGAVTRVVQETGWKHVLSSPVCDSLWFCPECAAKASALAAELLSLVNPPNSPWERAYPSQVIGTPVAEFLSPQDKAKYRSEEGEWHVNRTTGFKLKNTAAQHA